MSLLIPFPFGWLLNKKAARVEVNISLAFLHWVGIALHPRPFVSDIAIFVLKSDVNLQLSNQPMNVSSAVTIEPHLLLVVSVVVVVVKILLVTVRVAVNAGQL